MTAEDVVALELRNELESRISAWEAERDRLLASAVRLVELDQLIAVAKGESPTFKVAPRPKKGLESGSTSTTVKVKIS